MVLFTGALVADDSSYKQALARRDEILRRLQELQSELKAVDEFVTLHERLFPPSGEKAHRFPIESGVPLPRLRSRNILPPARLVEICREILLEAGHPMTRSELLAAIEARGIPLAGSDPSKNLGTILWRAGNRFENIPGRGYWPVDAPKKV